MKHGGKVLIIAVLMIVVLAAGCIGQEQPKQNQNSQNTQTLQAAQSSGLAILTVDNQPVEILTNGNWVVASNGTSLKIGDSVRTGEGGTGAIILGDNSIFRMDENTEVNVSSVSYSESSSNVQLYQRVGTSWSKVLGIGGGSDSFEVSTPTTVATVRGTSFSTEVDENGDTNLTVNEGEVDTASYKVEEVQGIRTRVETMRKIIKGNETAMVKKALIDSGVEVSHVEKISAWIEKNREEDKNFIGDGEKRIMRRYVVLYNAAKSRLNLTDTQAIQLAANAIVGKEINITDPDILQMQENFKEDITLITEKDPEIAKIITVEIGAKVIGTGASTTGIDYSALASKYSQYVNITK